MIGTHISLSSYSKQHAGVVVVVEVVGLKVREGESCPGERLESTLDDVRRA
jgi:hypothetical protein